MSDPEIITAQGLQEPVGYAHAVVGEGRMVFLGGQTAIDAEGNVVSDDIAEQFDQAAGNLVAALDAAGGTPDSLVALQVFVTDVDEYKAALGELGRVWRKHFGRRYPAMGLFGVTRLFDTKAKIELMGIAVL